MTLNLQPATSSATAQLQRIATDANATLAVIADALRRLEDGRGGYPTRPSSAPAAAVPDPLDHPSGGWACPVRTCGANHTTVTASWLEHWHAEHGPLASTQPERHALAGHDEAEQDTTALLRELHRAAAAMLAARRVAEKWGITKIGGKTTTEPRDDLWCTSCLRINHFSPRRTEGGTVCRWCADTLRNLNALLAERGLDPATAVPVAAVEKHAAGRRVTATDLESMARTPAVRRTRRRRTERAGR